VSLTTTIGVGALLGGVAAFAVYTATAPGDEALAAAPAVPTFAPVPTPTVTQTAEGCESPAVLTGGECVITTPGPRVVVTDPAPRERTTAPRAAAPVGDDDHEGEDHEGDDHEDDDHEDEDHEDDDESNDERDHSVVSTVRGTAMSWEPVPQSDPSAQTSCFQIGADSFSASIAYRAASNASARCGADTTTTTDDSSSPS